MTALETAQIYELDRAHVFHSWSSQARIAPMVVTRAEGSLVWDGDGNEYVDFSSQLVFTNVGHQHPHVVKGIQEQAAKLCAVSPSTAVESRSWAAHRISQHTPAGLDQIFFTNGGADANEHAVRMARLHTGRIKVLSAYRSYHGGTHLAINMTGDTRRWPNDYGNAGTVHFFGPFLYRSPFHSSSQEEESARALEHLEQVLAFEGPATVAAIIIESVPGGSGIMVPPPGYLAGVRELCDRHGIVFIADEVMAGFGRTGRWFAVEHADVVPDLMTMAKGITSGYVPLGAVAISPEIAATFADEDYPGGLTYSGHPLACAASVATIEAMENEAMVENAERLGRELLGPGLTKLAEKHPSVGEVRGLGAFWAVELVRNPETREPLAPYGGSSPEMDATIGACKQGGLLPFVNYNRLHVAPPLNIPDHLAQHGLEILDRALDVADAAVV